MRSTALGLVLIAACGSPGKDGSSCSVQKVGASTTVTCTDGTTATVPAGKDGSSCSVRDTGNGTHALTCTDGTTAVLRDGQNGVIVPEHAWYCPGAIPAFTISKSYGTVTYSSLGMSIYSFGGVYFASCEGSMMTVPTTGSLDSDTWASSDWYPGGSTTLVCFAGYMQFTYNVGAMTVGVVPVGETVSPVAKNCTQAF